MTAAVRVIVATAGVAAVAYGVWLVLRMSPEQLVSAVLWLGGGVVLHDAFLAPAVVVLTLIATRYLPSSARTPVALVGLVWGTVTVMALPVLSGRGGGDENATLVDRPYAWAWLVLSLLAVTVATVWAVVRARHATRGVSVPPSNTCSD